jgi:hypothetical protein
LRVYKYNHIVACWACQDFFNFYFCFCAVVVVVVVRYDDMIDDSEKKRMID